MNWKKNALRAIIVYALDMSIAIAGWTYGFGLHVQNWPVLIGLLLFSRFFTHMLAVVFAEDDAQKIRTAVKS